MRHAGRLVVLLTVCLVVVLQGGPAGAQGRGESVRGTLDQRGQDGDDAPVAGVEITVTTAAGEALGTVTTAEDGSFFLQLPGPGEYTATLDVLTLPPGVALRDPDRATLEFSIRAGQSRPLLYPLGTGRAGGRGFGPRALQLLVEGVKFGLIIAMTAIGLSLIFGTTGLVNFAHGELVTFGALVAWFLNVRLGVPLVVAVVLAMLIGGLGGATLDLGLWRPLRARGTGLIAMLVISIGMSLFVRYVFLYLFGGRTRPYGQFAVQRALDLGPIAIAPKDIVAIVLSLLVLAGVGLALARTRIGKAMRAVADNRDLAESSGIDVQRVIVYVWFFGGSLATLGGVLLGLAEQVSWQMGFQLLLLMFAGVILGGLGTAFGALLGSLVVGVLVQTSTLFIPPELKNVGALLVLIVILLIRPQGLLGDAERIG